MVEGKKFPGRTTTGADLPIMAKNGIADFSRAALVIYAISIWVCGMELILQGLNLIGVFFSPNSKRCLYLIWKFQASFCVAPSCSL